MKYSGRYLRHITVSIIIVNSCGRCVRRSSAAILPMARRVHRSIRARRAERRMTRVASTHVTRRDDADSVCREGPRGPSQLPLLLVILATFAIFYFILIRPQQKKQKELRKMIEALKKGDRVITSGGIFGTVVGTKDNNIVVLKIDENTKIEVIKTAVASVLTK